MPNQQSLSSPNCATFAFFVFVNGLGNFFSLCFPASPQRGEPSPTMHRFTNLQSHCSQPLLGCFANATPDFSEYINVKRDKFASSFSSCGLSALLHGLSLLKLLYSERDGLALFATVNIFRLNQDRAMVTDDRSSLIGQKTPIKAYRSIASFLLLYLIFLYLSMVLGNFSYYPCVFQLAYREGSPRS